MSVRRLRKQRRAEDWEFEEKEDALDRAKRGVCESVELESGRRRNRGDVRCAILVKSDFGVNKSQRLSFHWIDLLCSLCAAHGGHQLRCCVKMLLWDTHSRSLASS